MAAMREHGDARSRHAFGLPNASKLAKIGCTNARKNTEARVTCACVRACVFVAHGPTSRRVPLEGNLYLGGGEGTFIDL